MERMLAFDGEKKTEKWSKSQTVTRTKIKRAVSNIGFETATCSVEAERYEIY